MTHKDENEWMVTGWKGQEHTRRLTKNDIIVKEYAVNEDDIDKKRGSDNGHGNDGPSELMRVAINTCTTKREKNTPPTMQDATPM